MELTLSSKVVYVEIYLSASLVSPSTPSTCSGGKSSCSPRPVSKLKYDTWSISVSQKYSLGSTASFVWKVQLNFSRKQTTENKQVTD